MPRLTMAMASRSSTLGWLSLALERSNQPATATEFMNNAGLSVGNLNTYKASQFSLGVPDGEQQRIAETVLSFGNRLR